MTDTIYLYDSTLRDGSQARGVDFNLADKQAIARQLDRLGIDYIEGGWPGANPNDDQFFAAQPKLERSQLTAFGMTRRPGHSAANDPGLASLLNCGAKSICLVGKSWDFHVEKALEIELDENLAMIGDSVKHVVDQGREAMFDAEHFFDGYKANPEYALVCARAAYENGARWVVLCDTNGGALPDEIEAIVTDVIKQVPGDHLGIHCHNDTDNAVANSLAAVRAGVRQVQGTLNGIGERCGNANLVSILPNLVLKMGLETNVPREALQHLTHISRFLDDRLNRGSNPHAPYVGSAAFAHKGGLHVSAMAKDSRTYEHIDPELVGNQRSILISDKAGRSNILTRLKEIGMEVDPDNVRIPDLVAEVKERESQGFAYDGADASFELLARRMLDFVPEYFTIRSYRVIDERRWNARGELINLSEATTKVDINGELIMTVAEGNGPVNALDRALRKVLSRDYPQLKNVRLVDYKVRILNPSEATRAVTRVLIESEDDEENRWATVGVSANIIDASFNALHDSLTWKLLREQS